MLKIPAPGERTPPLVAALRTTVSATVSEEPHPSGQRRKKRSRQSDSHSWDNEADKRRRVSSSREKRQTLLMLAGGTLLLVGVVAGVMMAMHHGPDPAVTPIPSVTDSPKPRVSDETQASRSQDVLRSDKEMLALAEPIARKFLEATRVEDILPIIRNPKVSEPRIRKFHADGKIEAAGLSEFNTDMQPVRHGKILSVQVRTRDFSEKMLSFVETPEGIRVDWESWVGWSETSWQDFLASRTTSPCLFRLTLSPVDYFNFTFTDEVKWQSYYLTSVDGEHAVYGYVERGSDLSAKLHPPPEVRKMPMTLALRFPEHPSSANQVLIDRLVADGWVIETEETP
jgi:hypothetical protein